MNYCTRGFIKINIFFILSSHMCVYNMYMNHIIQLYGVYFILRKVLKLYNRTSSIFINPRYIMSWLLSALNKIALTQFYLVLQKNLFKIFNTKKRKPLTAYRVLNMYGFIYLQRHISTRTVNKQKVIKFIFFFFRDETLR